MAITAHPNFDSEIKWATGSGCLTCGSNVSDLGAEHGIQCVDLGLVDPFLGAFALCYDCALQVARVVDCAPRSETLKVLEEARALADEATNEDEEIRALAAQARIDRDVVERLVGSVYQSDDKDLADAVSAAL